MSIPFLVALYWPVWGHCAPLAAMSGRFLRAWQWPFLFLLPLIQFPSWSTHLVRAFGTGIRGSRFLVQIFLIALAYPLILLLIWSDIQDLPYPLRVSSLHWAWVPVFVILAVPLFLAPINEGLLIFLRLRRVTIDLMRLMNAVTRSPLMEGNKSRLALLRSVRARKRLAATLLTERRLSELVAAIERDRERGRRFGWRRPDPDLSWEQGLQTWYRRHARRGTGLTFLDGPILDELCQLLIAVQTALRPPQDESS
jgi:hypothetical protein